MACHWKCRAFCWPSSESETCFGNFPVFRNCQPLSLPPCSLAHPCHSHAELDCIHHGQARQDMPRVSQQCYAHGSPDSRSPWGWFLKHFLFQRGLRACSWRSLSIWKKTSYWEASARVSLAPAWIWTFVPLAQDASFLDVTALPHSHFHLKPCAVTGICTCNDLVTDLCVFFSLRFQVLL